MEEINAESGVHGADTLIAGDEADRYLVRRAAPVCFLRLHFFNYVSVKNNQIAFYRKLWYYNNIG